jgi:hypothetical protein
MVRPRARRSVRVRAARVCGQSAPGLRSHTDGRTRGRP